MRLSSADLRLRNKEWRKLAVFGGKLEHNYTSLCVHNSDSFLAFQAIRFQSLLMR